MYSFLLVNLLLVDDINDVHAVNTCDETDLSRQLIATRRIGFDEQRCNHRPMLLNADVDGPVALWFFGISAGHVEIVVKADTFFPFAEINR